VVSTELVSGAFEGHTVLGIVWCPQPEEVIMRLINVYVTAILLTSGLLNVPSASLVLADEPPAQSTSSTSAGGEAGPAPGVQDLTSPDTAPTMPEEAVPPAEGTDVQERGGLPGLVMPGAPLQFSAPTKSLSAIRNAMRVTSKSISVNLRIPPNLPVTVPVEVEIFYSSPFRSQILKRTYSPTTGLTLSYREAEGNGAPRKMKVAITVRELVPNGQVTGFSKEFTLTRLYDVFITDLRFVHSFHCDLLGKGDFTFEWLSPDSQHHEQKFKLGYLEAKGITQFSWARKEISTQDNLREPVVRFDERDPRLGFSYNTPLNTSKTLVPGPTTKYQFLLKEGTQGPPGQSVGAIGGCGAEITYTIIRALMPFDQF
jgi:hypothetical protein